MVKALGGKIMNFKVVPLPYDALKLAYLQRTGSEVIQSREVFSLGEERGKPRLEIEGCNDHALAMMVSLKALGIESKFARWHNHTLVRAKLDGNDSLIDMRMIGIESRNGNTIARWVKEVKVRPLSARVVEFIARLKEQGRYAEGLGPREIGMSTIKDFARYVKK